jgi:hypothetical protein
MFFKKRELAHMKRFLVAITALMATLAIGMATMSATAGARQHPKKQRFDATISLVVKKEALYTPGSFSGQINSGGPSGCREGRSVGILLNGAQIASAFSISDGSFKAVAFGPIPPGQYVARTPKVVIKPRNRNKPTIVCRAATSPPVNVS